MRTLALAISALLLASACTGEPEPIEPTASPSASSTVSPPALPDDSRQETPEAAIAYVKHWIEVFSFAVNTGAIDEFEALNDPKCEGCKSYRRQITDSNEGAAEVRNFRWAGGKATFSEDLKLEATIQSDDYQVRDSDSDDWSVVRGSTFELGFQLEWNDGRWLVRELYVPQESQ